MNNLRIIFFIFWCSLAHGASIDDEMAVKQVPDEVQSKDVNRLEGVDIREEVEQPQRTNDPIQAKTTGWHSVKHKGGFQLYFYSGKGPNLPKSVFQFIRGQKQALHSLLDAPFPYLVQFHGQRCIAVLGGRGHIKELYYFKLANLVGISVNRNKITKTNTREILCDLEEVLSKLMNLNGIHEFQNCRVASRLELALEDGIFTLRLLSRDPLKKTEFEVVEDMPLSFEVVD